jgi:hypothetical protein
VALPASITIAQNDDYFACLMEQQVELSDAAGVPVDVTFVVCDSKVSGEIGI